MALFNNKARDPAESRQIDHDQELSSSHKARIVLSLFPRPISHEFEPNLSYYVSLHSPAIIIQYQSSNAVIETPRKRTKNKMQV